MMILDSGLLFGSPCILASVGLSYEQFYFILLINFMQTDLTAVFIQTWWINSWQNAHKQET